MFNKLQSMFGKPHRVQPSHLESCITLETSQTKSETPFSQAPQELSITVSTSDDRNEDSKSDTTATHDHDEQAEELISNETSTNPNDVDNEKASLAGLEMLLRVDYYLGLSPFRLSTQGKAVSCCGSKVMYWLMNILAMLQVFISVRYYANLLDKDIRRKDDIFLCIVIGQHVGNGLLQFHYFYMLWSYQETILKIIRKLKHSSWALDLQQPVMVYLPIGLRLVSLFISFACCFSGLNLLESFQDWSFSEVLFENAIEILFSFPVSYFPQDNTTSNFTTGFVFSDKDIEVSVFGSLGILLNIVCQNVSSSCHDYSLLVAVIIFICVQQLHTKVKKLRELDEGSSVDWQVSAHNLLTEHDELQQICLELNEILHLVLPYINATSIITMSRLLQLCLRKSWLVAAYIAFKLIQTWVIYIIGIRIANQAASFKLWFISKKTVKVLQMDQKEYQAKLEEINTIPLGIGTDAFYTHIGFIASLFGVVLTYFFLATDAISDSR